jgi:hypothetical protein
LTPRKLDRTDVNGALIQAGKSSQKTSLSSAALQAALDRSGTSPKTGLRNLPVELLQAIIRRVASGSAGDTAAGLHAIMLSNRFLNASVVAGKSVKAHYDFLQPLIGAFKALKPPIHEINSHMLALMGPKQRQGQVAAVLDLADDDWRKARAIAGLGAGLAALERPQQQALVTATLDLAHDYFKAEAIAGLGAGLAALDRSQQEALVTAALDLTDALHKAQAIAALVNGYQASRVSDYLR